VGGGRKAVTAATTDNAVHDVEAPHLGEARLQMRLPITYAARFAGRRLTSVSSMAASGGYACKWTSMIGPS
jgi:hypothetical protein